MRIITRRTTTVVAAGMLTALVATAAGASPVTQEVSSGSLTATLADLALPGVAYSHADQQSPGSVQLTVDDSSASGDGWNVTVQSGDFAYTGTNDGTAIPAANFVLTGAATPVVVAGQDIDATGGPTAVTQTGSLDAARTVIAADAGFGQGTYTQDLGVALTVPGQSRAGTYTGTVTTTATSGPPA